MTNDRHDRTHLPIPDPQWVGVTTYDAKDPDTKFPPIEPLRPPDGAPNVLIVLIDDAGFGVVQRLRRTVQHADLRAPGRRRPQVHPVPHDRAVLADPGRAAQRAQPPQRRHGRHHRDRHVRARLQLDAAEEQGAAGRDAQAERLLHGPLRQVPRGAGLGDQPDGPVRPLAVPGQRLRALLRLHRRRDQPVRPGALPRHRAGRAGPDARRRATTSPRT